jgi:single-strand DNA-binding protein
MAGDTQITLVGNLVDDVDMRFTPSGAAVANFRVASTPRTFDKASGDWKDGESMFLTCTVWRQQAENCAESLTRGMRVIVQGRLKQRSYDTREGEKRTVFEIDVDEVGPALRSATAKVTKTPRQQGGGFQSAPSAPQGGYNPARSGFGQAADDPWGGQRGSAEEAPF